MKSARETEEEQIERLRPILGERICGGVILDETNGCRFEVWAYRQLTKQELTWAWDDWNRQRDRRCSLRGQTIRITSNHGRPLQ
jgi:hypothetical protein